MGRIADALRATLKTVAESDARALRDLDQELRRVSDAEQPTSPSLQGRVDPKALLGAGSFHQQTVANLKRPRCCGGDTQLIHAHAYMYQ